MKVLLSPQRFSCASPALYRKSRRNPRGNNAGANRICSAPHVVGHPHSEKFHYSHVVNFLGDQKFCGTRSETEPMNKYVLCLIGAIIGMAFIASCTQQHGTTATTTAPAVTKASPTPSPKRHKSAKRNPPKTEGSVEAPSPSPAESPAPTP
jgi:hypothetical protein